MTKKEERVVPVCIEWKADGTCAKFKFTEEEGLILDLTKCMLKDKEKMVREVRRGFKVEEK